jgi:hypothetical protein
LPRAAAGRRVTAAREGYFIAGAAVEDSPRSILLRRLPITDNEEYEWVNPAPDPAGRHNCANCHAEIYREWAASAHSRSATGQHLLNLYEGSDWQGRPGVGWGLLRDRPDGSGVCNACHVPTMPLAGEDYFDLRKARGVAAHGVHCDYCHKVHEVGDGTIGLTHGRFNLTLLRPAEGQLSFGPLDDVDRGEDVFSPLYRESRYCASCHEGIVFGVHVYSTYSEWLASPARREGKQCQTCHMAPTGRMTNMAPAKGGIERDPMTLANHRFLAGSLEEMLRGAVAVSVTVLRESGQVRAVVEVRADGAGHRVPTGFVDKHLVLTVEGFGATGQPLPLLLGPVLPKVAGRGQAGKPGRLYAKLLKDFEGRAPAPFWRADPSVADTRLEPGRPDRQNYVFPDRTSRLRVRLVHRRFWPQVAEAKGWADDTIVVVEQEVRVPR